MNREQAAAGAKWWADCLRKGARMDNGDTSENSALVQFMAIGLAEAKRGEMDADQIDNFERILAGWLESVAEDEVRWFRIGVDYHADNWLNGAGKYAGLDLDFGVLPWKTHMRFDTDGHVWVYGAGEQLIWPSKAEAE